MRPIESRVDPGSPSYAANRDASLALVETLRERQ